MKNQVLFNTLQQNQFQHSSNLILVKEFRKSYSIVVEFNEEDNIIVVCNYYYDDENKFDWPKRNVIFAGTCNRVQDLIQLSTILNMEDCAKDFFTQIKY